MWLVSNGSSTPSVSSTISRRLTISRGSTWGMVSRLSRAASSGATVPYSRLASSWGAASISGRSSGQRTPWRLRSRRANWRMALRRSPVDIDGH